MLEDVGREKEYIDITVPIRSRMVHWLGDPAVVFERTERIAAEDEHDVSHISMGSQTGTHVDAPCHYFRNAACIDSVPLDALIGPSRVLHIEERESVRPEYLTLYDIGAGDRILLKTENSSRAWAEEEFIPNFVYISHGAARYLVRMGYGRWASTTCLSADTTGTPGRRTGSCSRPGSGSSKV